MVRRALLLVFLALPAYAAPAAKIYDVDWKVDGAITLGAGLAGLVPYLFADKIIDYRCPCSPGEVNGFDRGSIGRNSPTARFFSDVLFGTSVGIAVLADGLQTEWKSPFLDDMLVLAEVLAVNGALNSLVKHTVQRPLPVTYSGQDPAIQREPEGYRSFYSGHTSNVFAALGFFAYTTEQRTPGRIWPWVVFGAGGAATALLRVEGGRHF